MTLARERLLSYACVGVAVQRHYQLIDVLMKAERWWIANEDMGTGNPTEAYKTEQQLN